MKIKIFCIVYCLLFFIYTISPLASATTINYDDLNLWKEEVNLEDYTTWRQDYGQNYLEYGFAPSKYYPGTQSWFEATPDRISNSNPGAFDLLDKSRPWMPNILSDTLGTSGGAIFALSKLLVASGITVEYSSTAPTGINPAILYFDSLYSVDSSGNFYVDGVSEKVISDYSYYNKYIERYWELLKYGESESIEVLSADSKKEVIRAAMDNGFYVIVTVSKYTYFNWDDQSAYQNPTNHGHKILLTGYKEVNDVLKFSMDDSLSAVDDFDTLYSWDNVTQYDSFEAVNSTSRLDFYKNKTKTVPWYLKLINKANPIKEDYILGITPKSTNTKYSELEIGDTNEYARDVVDSRVSDQLLALTTAYKKETSQQLYVDSGLRSWEYQQELYDKAKETNPNSTSEYSAEPGKTEHNAGIAVDFAILGETGNYINQSEEFSNTSAFDWLCRNAYKYGFILRYPKGTTTEDATGYSYTSNHWRYIGVDNAIEFIKFVDADFTEDTGSDTGISNVLAYSNMKYNNKTYEDYYLIKVLPMYTDSATNTLVKPPATVPSEEKQKYSDESLRRINYFMKHPIKALGNLFAGICQTLHNAMAVGKSGNVFDLSWVLQWGYDKKITPYYILFSAVMVSVALVIRFLRFLVKPLDSLRTTIINCGQYIGLSTLPVVVIYVIGIFSSFITSNLTEGISDQLAVVELSYSVAEEDSSDEVTTWELLTDEKLSKEIFRETFSDHTGLETYAWSTVTLGSSSKLLKDLFTEVSVEGITKDFRELADKGEQDYTPTVYKTTLGLTLEDIDKAFLDIRPSKYLYYNYNTFTPVNYDKYDESVFYYFYDYMKYQYLAYWASGNNESGTAITNVARGYTWANEAFPAENFPTLKDRSGAGESNTTETLEDYVIRITELENGYLSNAYSGMYLMMTDNNYVYGVNTDKGTEIFSGYYPTDIFGLSYLFNMTTLEDDNLVHGVDNFYLQSSSPEIWAHATKINYRNTFPKYEDFITLTPEAKYKLTTVQPITQVLTGTDWGSYKQNKFISPDSSVIGLGRYSFTPTYMQNTYPTLFQDGANHSINLDTSLSKVPGQRVPWRLYGSQSQLYRDTYSPNNKKLAELMPFELKLVTITESTYRRVREACSYMPGQVNDNTLIFIAALIATDEFNSTLSTPTSKVYPQGLDVNSLDLDKILRLTYVENIVDMQATGDTMYMIYDGEGGLFIMLTALLSEFAILLASISKFVLVWLIFINCIILNLRFIKGNLEQTNLMIKGVILQIIGIISSHLVLIGVIQVSLNAISTSPGLATRIIISILSLVVYILIATLNVSLLFAFLKDMKHFGGAVIQGALQSVSADYRDVKMSMAKEDLAAQSIILNEENSSDVSKNKVNKRRLNVINRLNKSTQEDLDEERDV